MNKKLYRSSTDKVFAGVCGGLGVYFNIDPTWIRLLWAIGTVCTCSTGLLAYIIAALIIPNDEIIQ